MKSHPRDTVVRAWARLTQAQQIVHASIEGTLKAAKLPPLAWYDALLELERAGDRGLPKNTTSFSISEAVSPFLIDSTFEG